MFLNQSYYSIYSRNSGNAFSQIRTRSSDGADFQQIQ